MKGIFLALALGMILLFSFGCSGPDTGPKKTYKCPDGSFEMNESECPNTVVAEPVLKFYTCPDGKNVTNLADCKKEEPAAPPVILTDAEKRTLQIEKVNNATGAIYNDLQALFKVTVFSETESTQGCREYYGYYQLILKRSDTNYATYMDELGNLAVLFGENQTCKDTVSEGKQIMAETWKDAYLKSAVVLALCSEPQSKRQRLYEQQTGEPNSNSSIRIKERLNKLDSDLAVNCERTYNAARPNYDFG